MANFLKVPKKIYDVIKAGAYKHISSEIYLDYPKVGKVLRAVALLGADIPAVKGLDGVEALYHQ